ncbi:ClpXP protease specificity-enhancing factor SspB [Ancylobacter sp. WKF20]|uniref:SspB family protein n=1 Tax=Ancylobacter sp. WKF20 TaxID=3039801 RepID=UPI0024343C15|nr:ClpXP protease specificity-enhancing factor SspB [Ancylobacter sp. WKF20]WGD28733.1 ClpXP protease specificity-enhancing factor SspB [Ancylobacter sp. WKF20]
MSVDLIRYDLLVQDALRAVVRRVLVDVARDGLPGDHHLYISFDTTNLGVRLSPRLKERYPEEMTIVLQHQFWDLIVTEAYFEVGLSFNGIPERLHVPFDSLKGFFDPSVKFGLQFEPSGAAEEDEEVEAAPAPAAAPTPIGVPRPTSVPSTRAPSAGEAKPPRPAKVEAVKAEPVRPVAAKPAESAGKPVSAAKPAKSDAAKAEAPKDAPKPNAGKAEAAKPAAAATEAEADGETKGAQVVRLDAFRKK